MTVLDWMMDSDRTPETRAKALARVVTRLASED
jgi:hypothetical protein